MTSRTRWLVLMLVLALAVAACGPGDSSGEEEPGDGGGTDGDGDGDADQGGPPAPSEDDTLVIASPEPFISFDPPVGGNNTTTDITWQMYEMPLKFQLERESIEGGEALVQQGDAVEPALATDWEISEDGRTYTLTIREGVTFYPSGNPMTVEDWLWSFERLISMEVGFGRFYSSAISLTQKGEIVDDRTFRFTIDKANPLALPALAVIDIPIMDSVEILEHATDEDPWAHEWVNRNSAGSGPYYLASHSESEVILERNPDYWGEEPYFARLIYRHVPDVADIVLLLRTGEVDVGAKLPPKELDDLASESGINVLSRTTNEIDVLWLNTKFDVMQDMKLREAVQNAVPYEQILETVHFNRAAPHDNLFTATAPGYVEGLVPSEQDLDAAREALEESDYDGEELRLLMRNDIVRDEQSALLIKDALESIGVSVRIDPQPVSAYFSDVGNAHMVLRNGNPWFEEGLWVGILFFTTNALTNIAGVDDPAVDEAFQRAFTMDDEERHQAYQDMQEAYFAQRPLSILARPNQTWAVREDIKDFVIQIPAAPQYALSYREQ